MNTLSLYDRVYRTSDRPRLPREDDAGELRKGTVLSVGVADDGTATAAVRWDGFGGNDLLPAAWLTATGHREVPLPCGCAGIVAQDGRITRTGHRFCAEYLCSTCSRITDGGSEAAIRRAIGGWS